MLALILLAQVSIPLIEENTVPIDVPPIIEQKKESNLGISIVAGGISNLGSQDSYSITPTAEISVDAKISDNPFLPRLFVRTQLSSLPEEEIDISDVTTFKSLEFEAGLEQSIPVIYTKFYFGFGVASRLPGDTEPRISAAKYFTAGALFVTDDRDSFLYLGGGPDQRLSKVGYYEACVHIEGKLKLTVFKDAKLFLKGNAILGGQNSLIRIGIVVGI